MYKHVLKAAAQTVLCLLLVIVSACSDDNGGLDPVNPSQPAFFTPEVQKMMLSDYETVQRQGWGNLVIPKDLYGGGTLTLSPNAQYVADRLHEAGFLVHLVGGTVRDFVMGAQPADFDFVTDATYEQCDSLFAPNFVLHMGGGNYYGGVDLPGEYIDLARYTAIPDSYFGKVSLPADTTGSLLIDSFQRDLPFNALYFDPYTEEIFDYHGGIYSIFERKITPMVEADVELDENVRVIIRAIRFAARYEYEMDKDLDRVIMTKGKTLLKKFPASNFFTNVTKLFNDGYAQRSGALIDRYDIWTFIVPSLAKTSKPAEYKAYIDEQLKAFDARPNFSDEDDSQLYVLATFLVPRYQELCATLSADEAFSQVKAEQSETCSLSDAYWHYIEEFLKGK